MLLHSGYRIQRTLLLSSSSWCPRRSPRRAVVVIIVIGAVAVLFQSTAFSIFHSLVMHKHTGSVFFVHRRLFCWVSTISCRLTMQPRSCIESLQNDQSIEGFARIKIIIGFGVWFQVNFPWYFFRILIAAVCASFRWAFINLLNDRSDPLIYSIALGQNSCKISLIFSSLFVLEFGYFRHFRLNLEFYGR